jgi:hypothetical protein
VFELGIANKKPEASFFASGFGIWIGSAVRFGQRMDAGVGSIFTKLLFDAEQLVVFRQAVGAAERAGLDLAAVRGHGDIGDGRVLGFVGAPSLCSAGIHHSPLVLIATNKKPEANLFASGF